MSEIQKRQAFMIMDRQLSTFWQKYDPDTLEKIWKLFEDQELILETSSLVNVVSFLVNLALQDQVRLNQELETSYVQQVSYQ